MKSIASVVALFSMFALPAFAEIRTITAMGEYSMSDYDTRADAKLLAFHDAKRIVLEQTRTYLETTKEVRALSLDKDEIQAYTDFIVEVTEQNNSTTMERQQQIIRVEAMCTVDTATVAHELDELRKNERLKAELLKLRRAAEKHRQDLEGKRHELAAVRSQAQAKTIIETRRTNLIGHELYHLMFQTTLLLFRDNMSGHHGAYSSQVLKRVTVLTRKALALDPFNSGVHVLLGLLLAEGANLDETISAYRTAAGLAPHEADRYYFQGLSLSNRNDHSQYSDEKAIAEFREAIRLRPDDGLAHYFIGNALKQLSRFEEAITEYRMAVKIKPSLAEAHVQLGELLFDQDVDGAITAYQTALQIEPRTESNVHYMLGLLLHRNKKDLEGAIREFQTAIQKSPSGPNYHHVLADVLRDKGDLDSAIGEYRAAIRLWPDNAMFHADLGNALQTKGDVEGAIAAYRTAIGLDPNHWVHHYNLGVALHAQRDIDGAIAAYRTAITRCKWFYDDAHFGLAVALQAKGQRAEAAREFREFVSKALDVSKNHIRIKQAQEAIRELK